MRRLHPVGMKTANTWTALGPLAKRLAARLTAIREGKIYAGDLARDERTCDARGEARPIAQIDAGEAGVGLSSAGRDWGSRGLASKNGDGSEEAYEPRVIEFASACRARGRGAIAEEPRAHGVPPNSTGGKQSNFLRIASAMTCNSASAAMMSGARRKACIAVAWSRPPNARPI